MNIVIYIDSESGDDCSFVVIPAEDMIRQRTEIVFYSDRSDETYCSKGFHVDDIRCILKDFYAPGDAVQS